MVLTLVFFGFAIVHALHLGYSCRHGSCGEEKGSICTSLCSGMSAWFCYASFEQGQYAANQMMSNEIHEVSKGSHHEV